MTTESTNPLALYCPVAGRQGGREKGTGGEEQRGKKEKWGEGQKDIGMGGEEGRGKEGKGKEGGRRERNLGISSLRRLLKMPGI